MKMIQRALALALALTLALAAGCSGKDTAWAARSGDDTIPSGVYLVELMMGYNEAAGQLYGAEDILKEMIGETPAPQYITDYAKEECANLLSIRREFRNRGLTVGEDEDQQASDYTDYLYTIGESFYKANGVEKESVRFINDTTMMSLAVFNSIYGEGGEREVPRADLEKEFSSKYTRSRYLIFPKVDISNGNPLSQAELDANKERAEQYHQRALAGESFPALIYQYTTEENPENAGEQQPDTAYDVYLENNTGYYPPAYEEGIVAAAENSVGLLEDDYYIYGYQKLPLLEGEPARVESYLNAALQSMKYDEYMELVRGWAESLDVTYNNAALAFYTPSSLKMTAEQLGSSSGESSSESGSAESSTSASSAPESGSENAPESGSGSESGSSQG